MKSRRLIAFPTYQDARDVRSRALEMITDPGNNDFAWFCNVELPDFVAVITNASKMKLEEAWQRLEQKMIIVCTYGMHWSIRYDSENEEVYLLRTDT